jgi:hypothetical protein
MTSTALPAISRPRVVPGFSLALLILAAVTAIRLIGLHFSVVDLFYDESQYWVWSHELASGYFSKPPLLAWIIAVSHHVCGDSKACVRAPMPILYFGTSLIVYAIARELYDVRVAFFAALSVELATGVAFSWWNGPAPQDNFNITRPFTDKAPQPTLYVTPCYNKVRLCDYFNEVEPLGTIATPTGPTSTRYYWPTSSALRAGRFRHGRVHMVTPGNGGSARIKQMSRRPIPWSNTDQCRRLSCATWLAAALKMPVQSVHGAHSER